MTTLSIAKEVQQSFKPLSLKGGYWLIWSIQSEDMFPVLTLSVKSSNRQETVKLFGAEGFVVCESASVHELRKEAKQVWDNCLEIIKKEGILPPTATVYKYTFDSDFNIEKEVIADKVNQWQWCYDNLQDGEFFNFHPNNFGSQYSVTTGIGFTHWEIKKVDGKFYAFDHKKGEVEVEFDGKFFEPVPTAPVVEVSA